MIIKIENYFLFLSQFESFIFLKMNNIQKASTKRVVYDEELFETHNTKEWESAYDRVMESKYKKNTKRYSTKIAGSKLCDDPPIFLIPRERAGPSYYLVDVKFEDYTSEFIKNKMQYCAISKGFGMQDLSSFVMGPFVNHGLCLVNSAFSKSIFTFHITGGTVDLNRKNFWKQVPKSKERHTIKFKKNQTKIDGKYVNIIEWLEEHEDEWYAEWNKWRKAVALCSIGNFHWGKCGIEYSDTLCYCDGIKSPKHSNGKYMNFVTWKKECYIKLAYDMLQKIEAYKFLVSLRDKGIPLGLVHPMARSEDAEVSVTRAYIRKLYDSPTEMSCMPFVVAGSLLDVKI